MNRAALRILAVAAMAMAGLIGLVVEESLARAAGTEVTLSMEAVDPRALLSGHYVTIGLREALPPGQPCPPGTESGAVNPGLPFQTGPKAPTLWIALARRGDRDTVAGASRDRGVAARYASVVARGTVTCFAGQRPTALQPELLGSVALDLGVDRFYADQDEARRVGALLGSSPAGQESPVSAILSIGKDGKARLKGLKIDGRRTELSLF